MTSHETNEAGAPMHLWIEPHGDLTACGIRWWNGTRGTEKVTCTACGDARNRWFVIDQQRAIYEDPSYVIGPEEARIVVRLLLDEVDTLRERLATTTANLDVAEQRMFTAEQRLAKVEALADEWEAWDLKKPFVMTHVADCADDLRAALSTERGEGRG